MAAVSDYTRLAPNNRIAKLLDFNARLQRTPESMAVLKEWQMSLDKKMVELAGSEL